MSHFHPFPLALSHKVRWLNSTPTKRDTPSRTHDTISIYLSIKYWRLVAAAIDSHFEKYLIALVFVMCCPGKSLFQGLFSPEASPDTVTVEPGRPSPAPERTKHSVVVKQD